MTASRANETVVTAPLDERVLVSFGFPVAGALAGWLLKLVSGWVADLRWAPFQGPFKLVASIDEPYATIGSLAVGVLAGAALAVVAVRERLTVTVTDEAAVLARGNGTTVRVERSTVDAVFLDGKKLVLLGFSGEELARETCELPPAPLADAFSQRGYPWRADGDPYRDEFRLWVTGMPGLPEGANALLQARANAWQRATRPTWRSCARSCCG